MRALSGERTVAGRRPPTTTTTAAAPSLICEALPAVTVPVGAERRPQLGQPLERRVGRGPSSLLDDVVALAAGDGDAARSRPKRPAAAAATARRWLSAAKAS